MLHLAFLLCYFTTYSQIIEIKNIEEVLEYIQEYSLCIWDIDNTILEPANEEQIGSEQWFYSTLQVMQEEMPYEEAKRKLIAYYTNLMLVISPKLVEESTARIINQISAKCTTIGFTARQLILAPATSEWLESYDIHFNALVNNKGFIFGDIPILLYNKVIYCSGHKTADVLFTILNACEICPTHIVYIDDKEHYLKYIENECERRGIEFIGLRYSYLDEKVADYLEQTLLKQPEIE